MQVFLARPCYAGIEPEAISSVEHCLLPTSQNQVHAPLRSPFSLLAYSFNQLWCDALNSRPWDYFAMIHSDIQAPCGWLDTLIGECERTGADILSAVVRIKNNSGDTSVATCSRKGGDITKLHVQEIARLPTTFGIEDVCPLTAGDNYLLLNTGLWICKFDKDWVEKVYFNISDRIQCREGHYFPTNLSEDWGFSILATDLGLTLRATTAVKTGHVGRYVYAM